MHDGIQLELTGVSVAVICTEAFSRTARGMAEVWGAPDYPVLFMPHPLSSRTPDELESLAAELAPRVAALLRRSEA